MSGERVRVAAVVGTYRKGGVVDQVVDEILASAEGEGAQVTKIYLLDTHVEFCTNCRLCTQQEGVARGICPIADEVGRLLDLLERSDALVLASPMNFGSVTAIMKRFIERLVCYAYWPWGARAPRERCRDKKRRAVLVASSAAPAIMARLMTPMAKTLKKSAALLGAQTVGVIFVGLAALEECQAPGDRVREKARLLGRKLARGR